MPPKGTAPKNASNKKGASSGGSKPRTGSASKSNKNNEKTSAEKRIETLEIENVMLRKDLNIAKIKEEYKKSGADEDYMNAMFSESLHEMQLRIQKYESITDENASGISNDSKKDLQTERAKVKTLEKDLAEKTKLINEKDKALREAKTEIQAQKDFSRNSSSDDKLKELQIENDRLKQQINGSDDKLKKLQSEHDKLKQQMSENESQISKQSAENIDLKNINSESQRPAINVEDKVTVGELREELKKSQDKVTQLKDENDRLEKDLNTLKENSNRSEQTRQGTEATEQIIEKRNVEINKLKEDNEDFKTKMKKQADELSALRLEMNTKENASQDLQKSRVSPTGKDSGAKMSDELEKKTNEISRLTKELSDATSNNKETSGKLSQKESQINKMQEEHKKEIDMKNDKYKEISEKLGQKDLQIKKTQEEHKQQIVLKDEEIRKLSTEKTAGRRGGSAKAETKSMVEKYEKTENDLKSARDEIDELKNRLSKVVGANIMNDNPNITDLSDENRPTKLSEKFSELYDNEWTDAYEEAEEEFHTEEKSIAFLYRSLEDIFEFCKNKSQEHASSIKSCVLTVPNSANGRPKSAKIGVTSLRLLKELRKSFAPYLIDSVFQQFISTKKRELSGKKNTEKFMRRCVEICWLMNSQDPPVILDTSKVIGKDFDGDRFRTYTKSGKVVDYVVWPPMLLHEGGPLLCKGVAQGKQK